MLGCLSIKSSSAASSATTSLHAQQPLSGATGNSTEGSPNMSSQQSPTFNLTEAYLSIQTPSYHEILSQIHILDPNYRNHQNFDQSQVQVQIEHINEDEDTHQLLLSKILQPDKECVKEALSHAGSDALASLFSTSFNHSEKTSSLCLLLLQSIYHTRTFYQPIYELLDNLPLDHHSITQSQCDKAFEVFLQFNSVDNPFCSPHSPKLHEMHCCFSDLKQQLDNNIRKSCSRVRLLQFVTLGSTVCIIGTAVAVIIAAVVIATHALVAIVAGPLCTAHFSHNFTKKDLAKVAQLDAARKGAYVLKQYLYNIDRLVDATCTSIEGDKQLVQLGLHGGKDKHSVQEVVKQLRDNQLNLTNRLKDLEEHICLCFKTVNWARSLLLQEIQLNQTRNP